MGYLGACVLLALLAAGGTWGYLMVVRDAKSLGQDNPFKFWK
jgi:hypothetical protein